MGKSGEESLVARRLRAETTTTLNWIAKELNMSAAGSLCEPVARKEK